MRIKSPKSLHYPITVSELKKDPGEGVERHEVLFEYTYESSVHEVDRYGDEKIVTKTLRTDFQSESEGTLTSWAIQVGDRIDKPG